MLTTAKAWELDRDDVIVVQCVNYTLIDKPHPGPPGWTSVRCRDRDGHLVILMIEGTDDVNVVRVKDYTKQINRARRTDAQNRSKR